MIAALLTLVLAAAPAPASASAPAPERVDAPVAVTTKVSPDPSNVGDLLTLEIMAAYPRGYTVNLPIGVKFDPLYTVGVTESAAEATGEGLRKTFTVTLQHFAPGPASVPGFDLTWVDEQGAVQQLAVAPTAFTVNALLANEPDPQRKPDDPPVSIEYPNTTAEIAIYSTLATLAGAALLAWAARRWLRRRRPAIVVPPIPPHRLALDALAELELSSLLADGRVQDYYVELTEIGKGYIQGRFGIEALERTTEEIRRALLRDEARIAPLSASEVIAFLQRCDLVKFARQLPDTDDARGALGYVRGVVERTSETVPVSAANAAPEQPASEREVGS